MVWRGERRRRPGGPALFGVHIGLYLTVPGFIFELVMPAWLIFKGFQPEV
jgi:hypothetical protein